MHTKSFEVSKILASEPTICASILGFVALLVTAPVLLKKSPFDAAEARKIVGGAEIEFSGIFYEAVYTAKWLDMLFVFAVIFVRRKQFYPWSITRRTLVFCGFTG